MWRFVEAKCDPIDIVPTTVREKSPRVVPDPVATMRVVIVGLPKLGKAAEETRSTVEPVGAPVTDRNRVVGSPVVVEPAVRVIVTA